MAPRLEMGAALATDRLDSLDVIVELLADADAESGSRELFDGLCQALCKLTSMRRAGLFLYDPGSRIVLPVGSHGLAPELIEGLYGTLDETPIAQRALAEDRVVEVSSGLEHEIPERYARIEGVTWLTCTPVSTAGRPLGVIFADQGGERVALSDAERQTMWSLGKAAALAVAAHGAADRAAQARLLRTRIDLARDIHERVIQTLSGVRLAIGGAQGLEPELQERCERELRTAVEDLRALLVRPDVQPSDAGLALHEELARLSTLGGGPAIEMSGPLDDLAPELDRVARSVLAEALRNATKHAEGKRVSVRAAIADDALTLEVRNRLSRHAGRRRGAGLGLRLAGFEALEHHGLLEYGPDGDEWRLRLVIPLG